MPQFPNLTGMPRKARSICVYGVGILRGIPFTMAFIIALLFAATSAHGQLSSVSSPTQGATEGSGDEQQNDSTATADDIIGNPDSDRTANTTSTTSTISSAAMSPLSSDQIVGILQQNPDLVVELKSQVADRLQEEGKQVDANDITDQMLYSQIATNTNVRASISTYLRARGYVSDDGLQSAALGIGVGTTDDNFASAQNSVSQLGNQTAIGLPAGNDLDTGTALRNENALPIPSNRSMNTAASSHQNPGGTRNREQVNTSTDAPKVLRRPSPYNLQSMRDLYTQIPARTAPLRRFGSEVFVNRDNLAMGGISGRDTTLDVPLGPSYVVGPGDTLKIDMWGSITTSISRMIDRDGYVFLPEAGALSLAGLSLDQAQGQIANTLKRQYRNAEVKVTVSGLRSVRVYVVGDVQRPGGYDISGLATPLGALYAAGGPTSVGSIRTLHHYRGKQLVEDIDLYDFLLYGVHSGNVHFESGDTLLVPPAGPQVAVFGAVKRPAIYELKSGESTLSSIVDDAGGFTPAASLGHISIERIDPNSQRETVTLNIPAEQSPEADRNAIATFQVKDGDRIHVEPILPYSQRAIYLQGHVVRPGRLPYTDGMHLGDVLHSYRDMLPEPATHGELVRLVSPDLHAETIEFNVPDVLIGNANVALQPFDTIRIFGRYEVDAPKVTIRGEVLRPGTYPMSKGMTTAQLVSMAGGFKRDALLDTADLTSYNVVNGNKVVSNLAQVRIGEALNGTDRQADAPLKPGDILSIHQMTGWNDIGQSIKIQGQIRFPGSYGFQDGERLSSVLRRAGGILPTAYPMGAVLIRDQVRELEQGSREELIRQIETNSAAARLSPNVGGSNAGSTLQLIKVQQDQVISDLKNHPPTGRMVIHITADIDSWANTPADIEVRRGDVLTIPKQPGFVLVTGQVYNATALTYTPDKTASWYLSHAGGTNATANRKEVFIIRANGSVVGRRSGGHFDPGVLSTKLNPGDVVVVPQKIIGASVFWRNLLQTGQLAASVAITAGVAATAL